MRRDHGPEPAPAPGRVVFEGVAKRFPGVAGHRPPVDAIVDVDLAVGPDEAVGLIGPNGAGKSTLLKLAAGVTTPSRGRIVRTGRTLAVIELGAGLHLDLTGWENVELLTTIALGRRDRSAARRRAIEAFCGLGDALDEPVRRYSTGMVARLAFAVATHCEPDLLLVDEVLSVGDLGFQQQCRDRITDLRAEGTTVLLVSHDLALIQSLCDRTVLVDGGRIEVDGDTDDTIDHYLGRPIRPRGAAELELSLASDRVACGQPVRLRFAVPADVALERVRIELVTGIPAALHEEMGASAVCGSTTIEAPPTGHHELDLDTTGLPPGRYELQVGLEQGDRRASHAATARFTLLGRGRGLSLRLAAEARLDGRPLAAIG